MATIPETNAAAVEVPELASQRFPALRGAASFATLHKVRLLVVSALVLIPCFWHQRIEAGDLSSHLYNAWLAQLIQQGKAPGLALAAQWNNILFDVLVGRTAALFGFFVAEKICVSLAVLIFLWGAFAFVSAASRRAPWFLLPVLAVLSYGKTFNMGFFNFYLSLGLAFLALAIVWRGDRSDTVALVVLLPLMWLAHPLGFAFFCAVGTYLALARILSPKRQLVLFAASMVSAIGISRYLVYRYQVEFWRRPFFVVNGADQLRLFNDFYYLLSTTLAIIAGALLILEAVRRCKNPEFRNDFWVPAQLYVVVWFTLYLLPNTIIFPQYGAPVAFLVTRMSLTLAVAGCCLLGAIKPRIWHTAAFAAIAVFFFVSLFLDTGRMNDMESQAEKLVATLPAGQRVVSTGIPLPPSGWPMWHLIDRACIGHCFMYSNYEPASQQFQIRALPGNPIVVTQAETVQAMQTGAYIVREQDLPLYGITQSPASRLKLWGRFLKAGERNGIEALR
jgi:hypothetical protein